jgi:hypothetical protein
MINSKTNIENSLIYDKMKSSIIINHLQVVRFKKIGFKTDVMTYV